MEEFDSFYLGILIIPFFLGSVLYYFSLYQKNTKPLTYLLSWNLIFTLMLTSIVFLCGETYYRFFVDRTQGFGGVKLNERWGRRYYSFNNLQIRDNQDYFQKRNPEKKQRISFLGDSFTEGLGIKNVDERFANIIRNHSPTKANNGMTPLEKKHGQKLPINQRLLRGPLFCLVFAFVYETERIKRSRLRVSWI